MQDFRNLKVWSKAHALTLHIYAATRSFPREESYGLTAQLRRAAASIAANIAEGCGRAGDAELKRFLQISMGSASELEYHLLLARDLGYLPDHDYSELHQAGEEMKRMLASLVVELRPKFGRTGPE
jgi:four helix bundle protein